MGQELDLSEFDDLNGKDRRPRCKVAVAADQLSDHDRVLLSGAVERLRTNTLQCRAIMKWLALRGFDVSPAAVTSHRDRKCSCES